jgi:hypothetical protein
MDRTIIRPNPFQNEKKFEDQNKRQAIMSLPFHVDLSIYSFENRMLAHSLWKTPAMKNASVCKKMPLHYTVHSYRFRHGPFRTGKKSWGGNRGTKSVVTFYKVCCCEEERS